MVIVAVSEACDFHVSVTFGALGKDLMSGNAKNQAFENGQVVQFANGSYQCF